jgi:hypothetical protein
MKLTRHAAMSLYEIGEVPVDQIIELEDEISDYVWSLLGDFIETYSPFAHRCQATIYKYLYEIDPVGISDEQAQNYNEYYFEASAIFWLLKNDRLTEKAIWALWIFYFDREISPYKDEFHPQLTEIRLMAEEAYSNSTNEPLA